MTQTTTASLPICPFNCCGVTTCNICLNPATGEFEREAEDAYPPEDAYVGYDYDGSPSGG